MREIGGDGGFAFVGQCRSHSDDFVRFQRAAQVGGNFYRPDRLRIAAKW